MNLTHGFQGIFLPLLAKDTSVRPKYLANAAQVARLDRDAIVGVTEPVNLSDLVIECVAAIAPKAGADGTDLGAAEMHSDLAVVSGNADLLRIMLRNLLDNAVRYTPRGGAASNLMP